MAVLEVFRNEPRTWHNAAQPPCRAPVLVVPECSSPSRDDWELSDRQLTDRERRDALRSVLGKDVEGGTDGKMKVVGLSWVGLL